MPTRTDELVNDVFSLTKIKLSPDDPLLAVILLQEEKFKETLQQQNADRIEQDKAFLTQLDARQVKIDAMYSELIQYRERVVAELLAKNQQIAIHTENRVQRKVSGSLTRLKRQIALFLVLAVLLALYLSWVFLQIRGWQ
ncbi:hypothetical protein W822_19380 [Advenella kashmirensis W13003]|uniref:Uncharacterized protein n=1 Tax=Advenella kashmirensis W13003 TaxID=1424334 RepID=V8QNJ5_9BURK|nr:hypothetical protein [Advenella kashmirensis]ETF00913.1 hypothetical protein W822_19380 [Advenella kashmirensis W13003]